MFAKAGSFWRGAMLVGEHVFGAKFMALVLVALYFPVSDHPFAGTAIVVCLLAEMAFGLRVAADSYSAETQLAGLCKRVDRMLDSPEASAALVEAKAAYGDIISSLAAGEMEEANEREAHFRLVVQRMAPEEKARLEAYFAGLHPSERPSALGVQYRL